MGKKVGDKIVFRDEEFKIARVAELPGVENPEKEKGAERCITAQPLLHFHFPQVSE